jgi:uncharacterized repeat protein (TIGR03803 family)
VAVFSFLAATGCAWTLLASNSPNNVVTDIAETAGIFTGRVIDSATLLPLENVDVLVYDANGGFVGKTQTGPDGLFSSPLLPPASYFVRTFNARGYVDQVFGGGPCLAGCDVTQGSAVSIQGGLTVADVDFALTKGGSVAGLITDAATGLPIANVSINVLDVAGRIVASSSTRTDGTYASPGLPPGGYRVRTSNTSGYIERLYDGVSCPLAACDVSTGRIVDIPGVAAIGGIDFALERGGQVAGTLYDGTTGAPLANTAVAFFTSTGAMVGSASTSAAGSYLTSGLPAGTYRARTFNALGYKDVLYAGIDCAPVCGVATGTMIVVGVGTTTSGVDFQLFPGGSVGGRVSEIVAGAPLAGVAVQLYDATQTLLVSAQTGPDGRYIIQGLSTGPYFARTANTQGLQDKWYDNVPCASGACPYTSAQPIAVGEGTARSNIDFVLDDRAGSELTVASASGAYGSVVSLRATLTSAHAPVAGAVVNFLVNGVPVGAATTNVSGVAIVSSVPLGLASAGSYARGIQAVFAGDATHRAIAAAADLTVTRLLPTIAWPAPAPIQYGVPLSVDQLNATANVPGTFTYTPAAGTILPVGDAQGLSALFVPSDSVNYANAAAHTTVQVTSSAPAPRPTFQVLHSFAGADGSYPMASLAQGGDGLLYSTTSLGGARGIGTVYRMTTEGTVTMLHAFGWSDGAFPAAGVAQDSGGDLVGTTSFGTLYRADTTGNLTTLHAFSGADGGSPTAGVVKGGDGLWYGTTTNGGQNGAGTIFSADASGSLTTLHSFTWAEGASPSDSLVAGTNGIWYGTTTYGGAFGAGIVFMMDPAGVVTPLHTFARWDGANPVSALLSGSDGNLYGTTPYGGPNGAGTVYRIDASGTLTTLHAFMWGDGAYPQSALIEAADGYFYGTTSSGGARGLGTIYRMDAAGRLSTLHDFTGADGELSQTSLVQGGDGFFYGTTYSGGAYGAGTAFRVTLTAGSVPSALSVSPANGVFGGSVTVSATLTAYGVPLAGEPVSFAFDGTVPVTAITDAAGVATLAASLAGVHGGNSEIHASFAGDAVHAAAGATAPLVVALGTPTLVWAPPAAVLYGTALGSAQLSAAANVPGSFAYDPPPGAVLPTGSAHPLSVIFTPADLTDYNVVTAAQSIDVLKATPQIVWHNPADIPSGAPLGAAQLNASADVPGHFTYAPGGGTVLPDGPGQTLTTVFTPDDQANYLVRSASASINVIVPVDITGAQRIAWDQSLPESLSLGDLRFALYLDGARVELGDVACAAASASASLTCSAALPAIPPGIHTLELSSFTVQNAMTFESLPSTLMFVVVKAAPAPEAPR